MPHVSVVHTFVLQRQALVSERRLTFCCTRSIMLPILEKRGSKTGRALRKYQVHKTQENNFTKVVWKFGLTPTF